MILKIYCLKIIEFLDNIYLLQNNLYIYLIDMGNLCK